MRSKVKTVFKKILIFVLFAAIAGAAYLAIANTIIVASTDSVLYDIEEIQNPESDCDCIIVLGCGVYDDKTPTPFLGMHLSY